MDPTRFDILVRTFAGDATRRRFVALLSTLSLGGALLGAPEEALAERPHERLRRRSKQRNRKQRNKRRRNANQHASNGGGGGGLGGAGPCKATGGACQQNGDCCNGNCFNQVCTASPQFCGNNPACDPNATGCCTSGCCYGNANQCNPGGECCAPNCAGRQCGPDGCGGNGNCGTCSDGATCNATTGQCGAPAICTAQNCPNGCCSNGPGNPGTCETGETFQQCGRGGEQCAHCSESQTCQAGQCTVCTGSCTCSGQSACLTPHAANAYCSADESCYCAVTRAGVPVCASGAIGVSGGCQTDQDCLDATAGSLCISPANNNDPENPCLFGQAFCADACPT